MIRPATDRQVLVLSLIARQGGTGAVTVPAAELRALLARLEHAETGIDPLPVRIDFGTSGRPLAIDLGTGRPSSSFDTRFSRDRLTVYRTLP